MCLTHLGLVTHICVNVLEISIDSGNRLSSRRCQAITRMSNWWYFFSWGPISRKIQVKYRYFHSSKCICKCRLFLLRPLCVLTAWQFSTTWHLPWDLFIRKLWHSPNNGRCHALLHRLKKWNTWRTGGISCLELVQKNWIWIVMLRIYNYCYHLQKY